jgi:hypothetical protein
MILPLTLSLALSTASAAQLDGVGEPLSAQAALQDAGIARKAPQKGGGSKGSSARPSGGSQGSSGPRVGSSGRPGGSIQSGARPQGNAGSGSPDHMPGNHGDASATRPIPSQSGTRPGGAMQQGSRPDSSSSGSSIPSQQARPGSLGPGSSGSGSAIPSQGSRPGSLGPGSTSGSDGSTRPSTSGDRGPDRITGSGGSASTGSSSSGGGSSSARPSGNRGDSGSQGQGSSSGGQGSQSTRPSGDTGQGGQSGSASTRPSGNGGSSSSSNHSRPSGNGGSSSASNHSRPSGNGGSASSGHSRPSSGHASHGSSSSRPSSSHARPGNGHRANHSRPYTPVHRAYYSHARPVYRPGVRRNVHWYHGVFVYGPAPRHHVEYTTYSEGEVVTRGQPAKDRSALPERAVDRNDTFSVGVQGGSYLTSYDLGAAFSDPGLGVSASYRPVETVGFELGYTYFDQTFDADSERQTATFQPSMNLYAVPWKRVSPYLNVGATMTRQNYQETIGGTDVSVQDTGWGPHVGAGLELALGERAALDLRGQYVTNLSGGADQLSKGALQGTAGLNFYF